MRTLILLGLATLASTIACQDKSSVEAPPEKPKQTVAACIEEICDRNIAWGKRTRAERGDFRIRLSR